MKKPSLDHVTTILMLVITIGLGGYVVANTLSDRTSESRPEPPVPEFPLPMTGAQVFGNPTGSVAIVVYSDYLCRSCAKFAEDTLKELVAEYPADGPVAIVLRHFPAGAPARIAFLAAAAATCAGRQGRFLDMHHAVFQRTAASGESYADVKAQLEATAKALGGLDTVAFSTCLASDGAHDAYHDMGTGIELRVTATPTIFIGRVRSGQIHATHRIPTSMSAAEIRRIVSSLLTD